MACKGCRDSGGCLTQSVVTGIAEGAALSSAISTGNFVAATLHMPDDWTAADIGFYASNSLNGTYQPLLDSQGNRVEMTVTAGNTYAVPPAAMAPSFIKLWSQNAGVDVNQAASRLLVLDMTTCGPEQAFVTQSITGTTTQEQVDSVVEALVELGLATDDR
jgi:hypothetical protein